MPIEKRRVLRVLGPFGMTLSDPRVDIIISSDFEDETSRCAINPRIATYIDDEKCALSEDITI